MKFFFAKKGFTIIELLIVMAILGVLGVSVILVLNPLQQVKKANDARRKSDLKYITNLLNLYYNDNGRYPAAGTCALGTAGFVYSIAGGACGGTGGTSWISALVPKYAATLPIDPVNNTADPRTTGNYTYAYGNVSTDGQHYDLITQLENQQDLDRCELKQYQYNFGFGATTVWCPNYSNYIYQINHE